MKQKKTLRIAFITNNYYPYRGGVTQAISATVQELRNQGHDARIITLDFLGSPKEDAPYVYRVPSTFRYKRGPNPIAIPWRKTYYLGTYLESFAPDIIHLNHPFLLGKTGQKIARRTATPTVFTYHTLYGAYAHYMPLPTCITRQLVNKIVPRFCSSVDRVIAPSSTIQKLLYAQQIQTPCHVIPSPVRAAFFSDVTIPSSHNKPLRLLYVGRFVKEKNIPFIPRALAATKKEFICNFVGYGTEYETLANQIRTTLENDREINFIHNPPQETLIQLYQEADLFLFPSTTDTQAIVLAEAMATGTPVITVPGPGQTDIVRHGYNGFFAETPDDMAKHIEQLDANRPLLTTLAQHAIDTAQRYHPATTVGRLLELYGELLGS